MHPSSKLEYDTAAIKYRKQNGICDITQFSAANRNCFNINTNLHFSKC